MSGIVTRVGSHATASWRFEKSKCGAEVRTLISGNADSYGSAGIMRGATSIVRDEQVAPRAGNPAPGALRLNLSQ